MNKLKSQSLEELARQKGPYAPEVFDFVRQGLAFTVNRVQAAPPPAHREPRHISGRELSLGLRDYAIKRYGLLARAVLAHWNVFGTKDFGRIVFTMVEHGLLQKTAQDSIHDFNNVFDFERAFEPPPRPVPPVNAVFDWKRDFR
jgi:uncharacterized repeat protein (TIGR04138 family)